jgi:hypothetical protein
MEFDEKAFRTCVLRCAAMRSCMVARMLGGPSRPATPGRHKIAENLTIFGGSPSQNGYATVTHLSGAQSFERYHEVPHGCRTKEMGACLRY